LSVEFVPDLPCYGRENDQENDQDASAGSPACPCRRPDRWLGMIDDRSSPSDRESDARARRRPTTWPRHLSRQAAVEPESPRGAIVDPHRHHDQHRRRQAGRQIPCPWPPPVRASFQATATPRTSQRHSRSPALAAHHRGTVANRGSDEAGRAVVACRP
jgi:hypothetical protein